MSEFKPRTGVTPYISVDGARRAIDFYVKAFGGIEREAIPNETGDRLIHGQVDINGSPVFVCDFFPDYGYPPVAPQAFNLHLHVDDAQMWWDRAVAAGAAISSPIKVEFWGDIYGQLKDPFGVTWAIGQSKTPE